ncbi:AAA family ATPase [Pseudomonas syringae pv. tagetis]|uniref:AAA family ATPase n=2 Tax=Pseudomonas syringae pv. tagetis TaxID=129140 RepID=A0ABW7NTN5_9PSED|nr:AAA family ATPase [Pseudomonas syringae group genomosp. 7]UNB70062.1 ATP-binding protein [Pseudomonas syringae pv. tagetis]
MKYRESSIDKKLRNWFKNDNKKQLLRGIHLQSGKMRGLTPFRVELNFPITAFAGVNGAGKSTLLAISSCAFHNLKTGFKLPKRKTSYYTFSDFFVQHLNESSPHGIQIYYTIAHDNWSKSETVPTGIGIASQLRKKKKNGRWNDYDLRVNKTVIFLGIERIVPHAERSQSRSYSRSFKDVPLKGWENTVKDLVGKILGKTYDEFRYLEHAKYSLPIVKVGGITYSGFNMGAGENALFEIFSTIYSSGGNSLLVLDEIELGLHSKAQRSFIEKLKTICLETGTQVICTTHSRDIFESLPDDARFFVESIAGKTKITPEIAPDFAFSKMSNQKQSELDIFVEDEVARNIIQTLLPSEIRSRVKILVIGSASAISRQLAALNIRGEERTTIAVYDADQMAKAGDNLSHAKRMVENPPANFDAWYNERVTYLPGDTWPEAWIVQQAKEQTLLVSDALGLEADKVDEIMEYGLQAGKHNEFFEISSNIGLDKVHCLQLLTKVVCQTSKTELEPLLNFIKDKLT